MKISYFFRKSSPAFHSIEEQFFAVQKELPDDVSYKNIFSKYHSKGIFRRFFITVQAAFQQGDINHITGDIHFAALFLKKRKTVLTVHDIGSAIMREVKSQKKKKGVKLKILRWFWFTMPFKRVKYVTVISEFTKREILKNFKINEEKIMVIPDCVSPDIKFSEKEFNKKKPKILQIGTKENKNLQNLIPALKNIPCELTIAGKLNESQKSLLKQNNIDYKNVYNLNYDEIIKLYFETDMVSFISTYEGFGVPILEAQATGRPVITSNISPMTEIAGEGAVFVDPFNVEEIKNGILSVMNHKSLRETCIKKGKENVKVYSAKSVAMRYMEVYERVRENPPNPLLKGGIEHLNFRRNDSHKMGE